MILFSYNEPLSYSLLSYKNPKQKQKKKNKEKDNSLVNIVYFSFSAMVCRVACRAFVSSEFIQNQYLACPFPRHCFTCDNSIQVETVRNKYNTKLNVRYYCSCMRKL